MAETSEHNIDPESHLVAIEIETRSAWKYRATRAEVESLIAKVAVPIFSSNPNDVIERV